MEPMLGKNPKTARVPLGLATHKEHTYRERSSSHIMISFKKKVPNIQNATFCVKSVGIKTFTFILASICIKKLWLDRQETNNSSYF